MVSLRCASVLLLPLLLLPCGEGLDAWATCPSDEDDEHGLLQQSMTTKSADRDLQPPGALLADQDGQGPLRRAQVRALGGLCGQQRAGKCPAECPLTARDLSDPELGNAFCTFVCVPATEAACVAYSPGEPIPDEHLGICRAASQRGCEEFVVSSATMSVSEMEQCTACSSGYTLLVDGTCQSKYRYVWYALFSVVGLFTVGIGAWLMHLACMPIVNNAGLEQGLATRSRAKLHTPKVLRSTSLFTPREQQGLDSGRGLWPLSTNLCSTNVAGPALTLHFNYMAMLILWAVVIMVAWIAFAYLVDGGEGQLFTLGMAEPKTPAETCAVVALGHDTQQSYMRAKAVFVAGCYVWSCVLFMAFSFYQRHRFAKVDRNETEHIDFGAILEGLPVMSGNDKVEDELCEVIEKATGHKPVGMSIAWQMGSIEQDLMYVIDENLDAIHNEMSKQTDGDSGSMRVSNNQRFSQESITREERRSSKPNLKKQLSDSFTPREHLGSKFFQNIERAFLTPAVQKFMTKGRRRDFEGRHQEDTGMIEDFDVEEELLKMNSCSTAFAIFETEVARNEAVKQVKAAGGMLFRDSMVTMDRAHRNPQSVIWPNFDNQHVGWKVLRCVQGILVILLALCLWTLIFYLPYAYYQMSFNYGQGQWPGMPQESTFVMMIVCGNATMYYICSAVADRCRFCYVGDRELCYTVLYYFSCLLNVLFDMICAYYVALMALVGVGSRTDDGILLADLTAFTARFNSYPMQLELGWTVFAYAFPCTFLLPFIVEPIATIVLPYKIMTAIVGYRRDIQGSRADTFLSCTPFDLSRYADVALNAALATLVFWFPSGMIWKMFALLAVSQVYIYAYDHYRVLRAVPAFSISSMRTDWVAQLMLAVPCGLLLSCALYKANCVEGLEPFHPTGILAQASRDTFGHCKEGEMLVLKCAAAFGLHLFVHIFTLGGVVPLLYGNPVREPSSKPYSECARRNSHSYFSVNPVHCLRSEYFYEHEPPFVFSRAGKEHLMPQNPDIGAFFSDPSATTEDYSDTVEAMTGLRRLSAAWTE